MPINLLLPLKMPIFSNLATEANPEPASGEQEQIARAACAFEAQEYAKAVALLLPLKQYPEAMCFLGLVNLGDPLQPSMRSHGWESLIASARAGFGYAWLALGHRYLSGPDRSFPIEVEEIQCNFDCARYWLVKGAEQECAFSHYFLAQCDCNVGDFVSAATRLILADTLGHKDAADLYDSIALGLDSETLGSAQKAALEWLNVRTANCDEWALRIAEVRSARKRESAVPAKMNLDAIPLH